MFFSFFFLASCFFIFSADKASGFTDVTATAGVGDVNGVYGVSWEDYNNDGNLDFWIGGVGQLYTNDGDGTFTASAEMPTGQTGVWIDADNDGDMDLMADSIFYDNNGNGTFTERSAAAGLDGSNMKNPRALDYNDDGFIDFFFPNGNTSPGNQIRENNGNSPVTFTNRDCGTLNLGCQTGESNGETATVGDVDNDGDIDIYYNSSYNPAVARLYYNDGDGTFTENAVGAGLSVGMGSAQPYYATNFGDYNNDGWLDLFLAHPSGYESRLFLNDGDGTFTRQDTSAVDANHGTVNGAVWGDYDNDGDLDLLLGINAVANKLYRNDGGGVFIDVAASLGIQNGTTNTASVSFSDYDNDGDLDIYYGNGGVANVLYRNDLNNNNYLKVKVVGEGAGFSPKDGIGTRIEIWDSTMSTLLAIREVGGGEGRGGFAPRIQHFGLSPAWGGGGATYTVVARFVNGEVAIIPGVVPTSESIIIGAETLSQTIKIEEVDNTPPSPNPMTFSSNPSNASETSVSMTGSSATDADRPPVEYFFDFSACASNGGTGGSDSGWQAGTGYTDSGLEPNHCYRYAVKARDSDGTPNEAAYSSYVSTYTSADIPGTPSLGSPTQDTLTLTNNEDLNPLANPTTYFAVQVATTNPNDATLSNN